MQIGPLAMLVVLVLGACTRDELGPRAHRTLIRVAVGGSNQSRLAAGMELMRRCCAAKGSEREAACEDAEGPLLIEQDPDIFFALAVEHHGLDCIDPNVGIFDRLCHEGRHCGFEERFAVVEYSRRLASTGWSLGNFAIAYERTFEDGYELDRRSLRAAAAGALVGLGEWDLEGIVDHKRPASRWEVSTMEAAARFAPIDSDFVLRRLVSISRSEDPEAADAGARALDAYVRASLEHPDHVVRRLLEGSYPRIDVVNALTLRKFSCKAALAESALRVLARDRDPVVARAAAIGIETRRRACSPH